MITSEMDLNSSLPCANEQLAPNVQDPDYSKCLHNEVLYF